MTGNTIRDCPIRVADETKNLHKATGPDIHTVMHKGTVLGQGVSRWRCWKLPWLLKAFRCTSTKTTCARVDNECTVGLMSEMHDTCDSMTGAIT